MRHLTDMGMYSSKLWFASQLLLLIIISLTGIVLGRRRITPEVLEEAILAMDETLLTVDFLSVYNVIVDISTLYRLYKTIDNGEDYFRLTLLGFMPLKTVLVINECCVNGLSQNFHCNEIQCILYDISQAQACSARLSQNISKYITPIKTKGTSS